jgi:hypothetical protein
MFINNLFAGLVLLLSYVMCWIQVRQVNCHYFWMVVVVYFESLVVLVFDNAYRPVNYTLRLGHFIWNAAKGDPYPQLSLRAG